MVIFVHNLHVVFVYNIVVELSQFLLCTQAIYCSVFKNFLHGVLKSVHEDLKNSKII